MGYFHLKCGCIVSSIDNVPGRKCEEHSRREGMIAGLEKALEIAQRPSTTTTSRHIVRDIRAEIERLKAQS